MKCSSLLFVAASCVVVVRMSGYFAEATPELCLQLIPQHSEGSLQSSNGGFVIESNLTHSNGEYTPEGFYESTCYVISQLVVVLCLPLI